MPAIRGAVRVSQRPTAAILQDHYAHFRDSFSYEVDGTPVWTEWDFALLNALQTIEDYTDPETGELVFVEQSDRVTYDATRYTKKSVAAVERKTKGSDKKPYKSQPGERWRTKAKVMDGGELPTLSEFIAEQEKKGVV